MSSSLPVFALLLNALIWGLAWWPFRIAWDAGLHPLWTTALLYGIALLGLLLWRPRTLREALATPRLWQLVIAAGLTNICFNWAVTVGDVVRVVLLFYLMPAWSVLLGWRLLGERPTPMAWLRLVLALAGVACVVVPSDQPLASTWQGLNLADGLALAGGFLFSLTNVCLRSLRETAPVLRMAAMFAGGAIMGLCIASVASAFGVIPFLPALSVPWLACTLGLVVAFAAGNLALQYGAARLAVATTSLIMLSEVLFASVSAVMLGAAQWQPRTLWGAILIVGAALLAIPRRTFRTKA